MGEREILVMSNFVFDIQMIGTRLQRSDAANNGTRGLIDFDPTAHS